MRQARKKRSIHFFFVSHNFFARFVQIFFFFAAIEHVQSFFTVTWFHMHYLTTGTMNTHLVFLIHMLNWQTWSIHMKKERKKNHLQPNRKGTISQSKCLKDCGIFYLNVNTEHQTHFHLTFVSCATPHKCYLTHTFERTFFVVCIWLCDCKCLAFVLLFDDRIFNWIKWNLNGFHIHNRMVFANEMNEWKLTKSTFSVAISHHEFVKLHRCALKPQTNTYKQTLAKPAQRESNRIGSFFIRFQSRAHFLLLPFAMTKSVLLKRSYTNLLHHTISSSTLCIRIQLQRFIKCNAVTQTSFFSVSFSFFPSFLRICDKQRREKKWYRSAL